MIKYKEYNLLLVRYKRWDRGGTGWEMTTLGWTVFILTVVAVFFGLVFGIVMAFEKAACNDVAEVTRLDVTYRNVGGCFVEASEGVWVGADAYFVSKVQQIE